MTGEAERSAKAQEKWVWNLITMRLMKTSNTDNSHVTSVESKIDSDEMQVPIAMPNHKRSCRLRWLQRPCKERHNQNALYLFCPSLALFPFALQRSILIRAFYIIACPIWAWIMDLSEQRGGSWGWWTEGKGEGGMSQRQEGVGYARCNHRCGGQETKCGDGVGRWADV